MLGLKVYGFTDMQNGYMFGIVGLTSAIVQGGLIGRINKVMSKKTILMVTIVFLLGIGLGIGGTLSAQKYLFPTSNKSEVTKTKLAQSEVPIDNGG
ncbi:MAG: hypothetical protein HGB14_13185, partial [Anaerolineaceae bacterium]|nr:hypothetical protein [Anaerolineaceae bacterium]